jgi:hypothetical protein
LSSPTKLIQKARIIQMDPMSNQRKKCHPAQYPKDLKRDQSQKMVKKSQKVQEGPVEPRNNQTQKMVKEREKNPYAVLRCS